MTCQSCPNYFECPFLSYHLMRRTVLCRKLAEDQQSFYSETPQAVQIEIPEAYLSFKERLSTFLVTHLN